jgi:hypothetical protein
MNKTNPCFKFFTKLQFFNLFVEDYVCMQFGRVSDGKFDWNFFEGYRIDEK